MRLSPAQNRLRRSFARAAVSYESHAVMQKTAAERVASLCRAHVSVPPRLVLELGCGTGLLTRPLRALWPEATYIASDIALPMAQWTAAQDRGVLPLVMDAAHPCVLPVDAIVSSFALQWLPDPVHGLKHLAKFLKSDGRLIVALPGRGAFAAWSDLCTKVGVAHGLWQYPTAEDFITAGLTAHAENTEILYPDARAFLQSLKKIGAQTPRPDYEPLSPTNLRRVLSQPRAREPFAVTCPVLYVTNS